jgi:L-cysteine/cystine lyase
MMRCVDLDAVRTELPVLACCAYLNTGTFGPLPRRTVEAMCARQYDELENGRRGRPYFEEVRGLRSQVREAIRELLNTALTRSTGDGCNIAVASLRLSLDDEIVTTDDEHFGLLGPLHVSGARVRVAAIRERPLDEVVAAIKAEISPRTRLLAVSHVTWTTGRVLPVRELADLPIPLLVDGAQGAGAVPVDVDELGCDFYTVSGQKWLLGPDGTGALYVRPEMIDRIHVPFPSYFSQQRHEATGAFVPAPGALRLEPGTLAAPALAGLLASLSFAAEVGEERFARARALTERCRELLSERLDVLTPPGQATLVSFRPRGRTAEEVVAALAERGIVVREFPGLDWIRASIGFWTSEEEIERLVEAL